MKSLHQAYLNICTCLERDDHSGAMNVLLQTRFALLARVLPDVLWGPRDAVAAGKDWIIRLARELCEQEQRREQETLQLIGRSAENQTLRMLTPTKWKTLCSEERHSKDHAVIS